MPRTAKRTKIPPVETGQPYGVASDQQAALEVMPLADGTAEMVEPGGGPPPPGPGPAAPSPGGGPPVGAPPSTDGGAPLPSPGGEDPLAGALMAAIMGPSPAEGGLTAPTAMPEQDLLTMPIQRQAGRVTPTARVLSMLAEQNGNDPGLRAIADDAAMKGY